MPRNRLIVLAFAGDSTTTKVFDAAAWDWVAIIGLSESSGHF